MALKSCKKVGKRNTSSTRCSCKSVSTMPSGKKHKDFKASSSGAAEVVLGGGTYVKKHTPGNVHGMSKYLFTF